ncbi:MAG: hypothetical protein HC836_47470 [Richelia sp. RM2_1_2]|nr:hypothetical protein [Richelia sp. RM2_1_2]
MLHFYVKKIDTFDHYAMDEIDEKYGKLETSFEPVPNSNLSRMIFNRKNLTEENKKDYILDLEVNLI